MSNINETFKGILSSLSEELTKYGFEEYTNDNTADTVKFYQGEKGTLKFQYENGILALYAGDDADNATKRLSSPHYRT